MTKIESKAIDFVKEHILVVFVVGVTVLGLLLRFTGMEYESDDYRSFLKGWWMMIEPQGLGSLSTQIGNYNIPYQFLIGIMTALPFGPLVSYKLLSIIFDVAFAAGAAMLAYELMGRKSVKKASIVYALCFCSINVIFNSGFWAQCDSMYVSLILFSMYFLIRNKNIPSFVLLGAAFAFKLQTVFIIPFFLMYWFMTKKCSILHFFLVPLTDIVMCLPAVFMGRNFMDIFSIYLEQTDYGKQIYMNCPNFYALICDNLPIENYNLLKPFSIVLTILVLAAVFALLVIKKADLEKPENFLMVSVWSVWTCIMFLSSMHERYSYLLDALTIILVIVTMKNFWTAILCNLVTLRGYAYYLFTYYVMIDIKLAALAYMIGYIIFTIKTIKTVSAKPVDEEVALKSTKAKKQKHIS